MARRIVRRTEPVVIASLVALVLGGAACSSGAPIPTPSPSETTGPTATAADTAPPIETAQAPVATLAVEGGDPVVGQLGTFAFGGSGSESPWLRGAPIRVGQGERLAVSLEPAVSVAAWTSRYVPSSATGPDGAVGLGQGAGMPSFDPPPVGSWTVEVRVIFAAGQGDALYFWAVAVD